LSAPRLSKSITEGSISTYYSISGPAQGEGAQKTKDAQENVKRITSVLKGGALPVKITLGSKTVLPPQLGMEFLRLSLIGIAASLLIISIMIGIRYMKKKLIIPVVIISISELIILISILGSFTIDLAAMAGIIAAIGVGVDAQIVITDEILKKQSIELQEKLENAFKIIKINVIVAIVAMLPLLFSGMVEIIGFSISTILGALLGYLLSRPAYAAIVRDIAEH
jgi:preprotein translocase subunit SecD